MLLLFVALWLKTHHRFDPDSNKQFENIFWNIFQFATGMWHAQNYACYNLCKQTFTDHK